jgi:uncharacterized protein
VSAASRRNRAGGGGRRAFLFLLLGAALGGGAVYLLGPRGGAPPEAAQPAAGAEKVPPKGTPAPTAPKRRETPSDFEPVGSGRGVIALVLDDLGNGAAALSRVGELPGPIALAVLPDAPAASEAAALAGRKGWDLLLHLPLASASAGSPPGAISSADGEAKIEESVARALERVPGAIGVNNHEGSAAMADRRVVRTLLRAVRDRRLFFLDSRTGSSRVAEEEAKALGMPILSRDLFLDAEGEGGMAEAWGKARKLALRKGTAIVIAHPHPASLDFLSRELPGLDAQGIRLVKLSELVD